MLDTVSSIWAVLCILDGLFDHLNSYFEPPLAVSVELQNGPSGCLRTLEIIQMDYSGNPRSLEVL